MTDALNNSVGELHRPSMKYEYVKPHFFHAINESCMKNCPQNHTYSAYGVLPLLPHFDTVFDTMFYFRIPEILVFSMFLNN